MRNDPLPPDWPTGPHDHLPLHLLPASHGTAFAEIVTFEESQVELEGEEPRMYEHRSDESGRWIRVHFCPHCGTHLFITAEARPGFLSMAGGTLDDPSSGAMGTAHLDALIPALVAHS